MSTDTPLTDADPEQLRAWVDAGHTVTRIAYLLRCSERTARRILSRHRIPYKRNRPDRDKELVSLHWPRHLVKPVPNPHGLTAHYYLGTLYLSDGRTNGSWVPDTLSLRCGPHLATAPTESDAFIVFVQLARSLSHARADSSVGPSAGVGFGDSKVD